MRSCFLVLVILFSLSAEASLRRIAFGSCSDQKDPQPLWLPILKDRPDLFIHGGDNIYADTKDPAQLKASYDLQWANTDYQTFRKSVPVIGIWDDHDFGYNDSDGNNPIKNYAQKYFLDFLNEPASSPRRKQQGIYQSYSYGRIKIFLLDNRYFRKSDPKAPLLGETQWQWLEKEIKESKSDLNIIVSGLTVFSKEVPGSDEWADYPVEQNRLVNLLKKYRPKGLLVLSGDKHFASIYKRQGFLEFLSSGMTHNRPRYLQLYFDQFFQDAHHVYNYGLVDIKWDGSDPEIQLSIKSLAGQTVIATTYKWQNSDWVKLK